MQAYLVAVELRGSIRSALIENGHIHMILNLVMSRGAYEVNPIMAYALSVSPSAFLATKYVLTCIAALIVLMLRDVVVVLGKKLPTHVLLYFFWGLSR